MTTKLDPRERRAQILTEAVKQAAKVGYQRIKRDELAAALGVSPALINAHFTTMEQLKRDVMRQAVATASGKDLSTPVVVPCALRVVAQGIVARDRHAGRVSETVKAAALAQL